MTNRECNEHITGRGREKNPLRRNVIIEEVGNTTAFPCSDLASGITGDIVHVDSGYHILGMV
ncbi:MAG: SDR family oxidoreductase [Candidatus Thiodiazotropha sp.]